MPKAQTISELPELKIFAAGTWVDNTGTTYTIDNARLNSIAADFNASGKEIPIIPGHPKGTSVNYSALPAYGWINKLRVENGEMFGQLSKASDVLKDVARQGIYNGVSAGFNLPNWKPTHLAATNFPSLDHLPPLDSYFSDDTDSITEIYFAMADNTTNTDTPATDTPAEPTMKDVMGLLEKILEAVTKDVEADKTETPPELTQDVPTGFSAEVQALQKQVAELTEINRRNELTEMLRGADFAGKITPAEIPDKVEVLMELSRGANFSAANEESPYAKELRSIKSRPTFEFAEFATHQNSGGQVMNGHATLAESIVKSTQSKDK